MKRFIILLIAVLCTSISAFAQESNDNPANEGKQSVYFIEVYEINALTMKSVCINFGLNAGGVGKTFKLFDEDGDHPLPFDNIVGALNYLGQQGWEVMTVYNREVKGSGQNIYYLMRFDAAKYPKTLLVKTIDEQVLAKIK